MPLDRSEITSSLLRKGFKRSQKQSKHHDYFLYHTNDKVTSLYTYVSRGTKYKTLSDPLVSKMAKQTKLTNDQFHNLVDCTLTAEEYKDILTRNNHIENLPQPNPEDSFLTPEELVPHDEYLDDHYLFPIYLRGNPEYFLVPKEAFTEKCPEDGWPCYSIDREKIEPVQLNAGKLGITL